MPHTAAVVASHISEALTEVEHIRAELLEAMDDGETAPILFAIITRLGAAEGHHQALKDYTTFAKLYGRAEALTRLTQSLLCELNVHDVRRPGYALGCTEVFAYLATAA